MYTQIHPPAKTMLHLSHTFTGPIKLNVISSVIHCQQPTSSHSTQVLSIRIQKHSTHTTHIRIYSRLSKYSFYKPQIPIASHRIPYIHIYTYIYIAHVPECENNAICPSSRPFLFTVSHPPPGSLSPVELFRNDILLCECEKASCEQTKSSLGWTPHIIK